MSWAQKKPLTWFEKFCVKVIKSGSIPQHVAFIMDGNRRYANISNVNKSEGHAIGYGKLVEILKWCTKIGIPEVTVYAFSIENFKRSLAEINALMRLFKYAFEDRDYLMKKGVRIQMIGNISYLPTSLYKALTDAIVFTQNNAKIILNVALAYTASEEMTNAVKKIAEGVSQNDLSLEDINEHLIGECLYTSGGGRDPDLLIRTSGETRLSDFLLWQSSCSCIYITDTLWPEFNIWNMLAALFNYQRCSSSLVPLREVCNIKQSKKSQSSKAASYVAKIQEQRRATLRND